MTYPFEHDVTVAKLIMIPVSHLFILPAAYFAYKLKLYDVVIGVFVVYVMSQIYHFVECRVFGIDDIYTFWIGDYACIFLLGLIVLMVWNELPTDQRYYIVLPTILVWVLLGKLFHDTALLFVLLGAYFVEMLLIHKLYMMQVYGVGIYELHIANFIFYFVLMIIVADGIFFLYFAGNPGDRYYFWYHVAGWHIPIFCSFSLLLGYKYFVHISKGAIKKAESESLPPPNVMYNIPTNLVVRSGLPDATTLVNRKEYLYPPEYEGL